ncbi:unnamed protein product [Clavelina lepadiformis]
MPGVINFKMVRGGDGDRMQRCKWNFNVNAREAILLVLTLNMPTTEENVCADYIELPDGTQICGIQADSRCMTYTHAGVMCLPRGRTCGNVESWRDSPSITFVSGNSTAPSRFNVTYFKIPCESKKIKATTASELTSTTRAGITTMHDNIPGGRTDKPILELHYILVIAVAALLVLIVLLVVFVKRRQHGQRKDSSEIVNTDNGAFGNYDREMPTTSPALTASPIQKSNPKHEYYECEPNNQLVTEVANYVEIDDIVGGDPNQKNSTSNDEERKVVVDNILYQPVAEERFQRNKKEYNSLYLKMNAGVSIKSIT